MNSQGVISSDGRWVAFASSAKNLVAHDSNPHADVFLWSSETGRIRRITRGNTVNDAASLSADGRFVAYASREFDPDDPRSQLRDLYVWDRATGKTVRVTPVMGKTSLPMISDDGKYVVYQSRSTELVPGDWERNSTE